MTLTWQHPTTEKPWLDPAVAEAQREPYEAGMVSHHTTPCCKTSWLQVFFKRLTHRLVGEDRGPPSPCRTEPVLQDVCDFKHACRLLSFHEGQGPQAPDLRISANARVTEDPHHSAISARVRGYRGAASFCYPARKGENITPVPPVKVIVLPRCRPEC